MFTVKLIHNAVMELRATSGANAKKEALARHFSDPQIGADLGVFLTYVYDPRRSYYQTNYDQNALPRMMMGKVEPTDVLDTVYDALDRMNRKEALGKAGAQALCKAAAGLTPEGKELVQILLDRDIKAGMAAKSINKAWMQTHTAKLIDTVPYQRYGDMTIEKLRLMNFKRGVYSQLKSDGMFGNVIIRNGHEPQLLSRSGSVISGPSVEPMLDYIEGCCLDGGVGNSVFHGELLVRDTQTNTILKRAVGNGMINSVIQTGQAMDTRYRLEYRVWDVVFYEDWFYSKKVITPYEMRWNIVEQLFDNYDNADDRIVQPQESRVVHSFEEAVDHLKELLARKEEGTIWKPHDMPWEDGTSEYGMKGKLEMECELEIIGFKPGDQKGKHASTFGSIMMRSHCGLLEVNVSGLSDALRKVINNSRDEYIKKIATVRSNGVQDKTGNEMKSLFLPRLVEIRDDRTQADTLERIYEIQESTINNIKVLLESS
ncbi:DNA ligase [Erwinia phage vB_EamM-Bue1]|uniref:DNA ligase n=1 Tax=Erwinia phage vB_EamM-Bue1 TaxID=2099338 RepID=A0A2P1JU44_9CAUD|nr:DNA ligase [Erwinia phage vB_EamM-Bue1]AVO22876.1 DNA ligase [Erwinia phage vB_EamM-Bue1]